MQTLRDNFITRNYILSLKAENNKGENKNEYICTNELYGDMQENKYRTNYKGIIKV